MDKTPREEADASMMVVVYMIAAVMVLAAVGVTVAIVALVR